ncbi:MAG TPA: hypothetical protein VFP67_03485 [Acidimicrobiia bacterium]|nr:hypothetical protein [Acidimicrobiia bacterium]
MRAAALVASALLIVIAVFQIALALGMPARKMAWGGGYEGKLPTGLRVASGVAGFVIYPLAALLVLEAGELTDFDLVPDVGPVGMWVLTGLFALAAILNFLSRSRVERVWGPVALGISVCCGIVAASL